jgi:hypothetical protein
MSSQPVSSFVIHKNSNIASNVANAPPKKNLSSMSSSLDLGEFTKLSSSTVTNTKPIPPDQSKGFVMSTTRRGQEDFY